jgi:hypothetical protein
LEISNAPTASAMQEFYQFLDQDAISDDIRLFNEQLREWENH